MLQDRTCRQCGRHFEGGPRAYYCPSCRTDRQREQDAAYKRRKRKGKARALGSLDRCEQCGGEYTVSSGMQRYCPACGPVHAAEHDRVTALVYYHDHKARINPARYTRRRAPPKKCAVCGREFAPGTRSLTCSPECRRRYKNNLWNEWNRLSRKRFCSC